LTSAEDDTTGNTVAGGVQHGPVLQGRNFRDVTFNTVQAAAVPVALAQLPAPVTAFSGRQAELEQLTALLNPAAGAGTMVVSAVAGLAGVGKTALAIQAAYAARKAGWFPGGVLFLDLHGYDDKAVQPGQALDALLRALGIPGEHIPPGTEERAGLYRSALAAISGPVLVIADNASAEAQVRLLLPGPGPHRVLVTSRHTLAGLGARLLDVAVLDDEAAIGLVEGVLRAARPDDDRIAGDPGAARGLAQACGGLPLALRITAALLAADPSLTAANQHLKALPGMSVPAQFTGRDQALAWLDAERPSLIAAVTMAAGTGRDQVAMTLPLLISEYMDWRRRFDDVIAILAISRDTARRLGNQHYEAIALTSTGIALGQMRRFEEAITAHQEAAATFQETGDQQGESAAVTNLGLALQEVGRFEEAITAGRDAAAIFRAAGDRRNEGMALGNLGLALQETGRFEEAIAVHQEGLAIFRTAGDRHAEGMALGNVATALGAVGRFEEAVTVCRDAAAIFRAAGDRHAEGMALGNLGFALGAVGRPEEAVTAYQDAAAIFRAAGDRHNEGIVLNILKSLRTRTS